MNNTETKKTYFHRVAQQSKTLLWINNATPEQAQAALSAGAVGASTNPSYASKLPAADLNNLIDKVLNEGQRDEDRAAEAVYMAAAARLQTIFFSLYEESGGQHGWVAIQGDPRVNTDVESILAGAMRFRKMGPNIIVKVPSTPAGGRAMEELTAMGCPSIGTLGFSVDQAAYMAEAYRRGLGRGKTRPFCMVTFIVGVLEDYLKQQAQKEGGIVSTNFIEQGSIHGHRAAYRLFRERGYEAHLIGGGARRPRDFTELVGGDHYITIGWDLADQLIKTDGPVEFRIDADVPETVVAELDARLPDYARSHQFGSLQPEEFGEYGPVAYFQSSFLTGVDKLLKAIRQRQVERAAAHGAGETKVRS